MGAKSRGNYPIGMFISQEDWDKWFPKEGQDGTKSKVEDSNANPDTSDSIHGESGEGSKEGSS